MQTASLWPTEGAPAKGRLFLWLIAFAVANAACSESAPPVAASADVEIREVRIASRGIDIPGTLVLPTVKPKNGYPLVVMAHGHGGSRQEGGGYKLMAAAFADRGIASIRVDFPGCGDSDEAFTQNNLTNMLADLQAAAAYAIAHADIDEDRLGLLGYSMGGRVVALFADAQPQYRVMAMWTPAVQPGAAREAVEFGGDDAYRTMRQLAQTTGVAEYTTRWGQTLQLGPQWFVDMETRRPLGAIARFSGSLLVLYGDRDPVVVPAVSEAAIAAATSSTDVVKHVVADADHALGFYDNRPPIAQEVVTTTADFFTERL